METATLDELLRDAAAFAAYRAAAPGATFLRWLEDASAGRLTSIHAGASGVWAERFVRRYETGNWKTAPVWAPLPDWAKPFVV